MGCRSDLSTCEPRHYPALFPLGLLCFMLRHYHGGQIEASRLHIELGIGGIFPRASAKVLRKKTSAELHLLYIFTSSPLYNHVVTSISAHLHICTSSHLHLSSSSSSHIYISAHLHICASTSLLIFTSSYLHLTSSPLALLNFLS